MPAHSRLRVTLLHDGTNADVDASLTLLWRAIPPSDVDVNLITLQEFGIVPGLRTVRGVREISKYLSRDRCDVVYAWLARPALVCGLLRTLPDRPVLITGVPGTVTRMENHPGASAAHIAAGFLADLVTTWHPETADWLVRSGLPSDAVAVVENVALVSDSGRAASTYLRLFSEADARRRAVWRRYFRKFW